MPDSNLKEALKRIEKEIRDRGLIIQYAYDDIGRRITTSCAIIDPKSGCGTVASAILHPRDKKVFSKASGRIKSLARAIKLFDKGREIFDDKKLNYTFEDAKSSIKTLISLSTPKMAKAIQFLIDKNKV